ncbi:Protein translation factor SUI1-like protein [Hibiscus syriacus]|uniref:Protein translation factor SUI1-like protein n=1 Tax=Hibiscus syriacus TaxID=106335 RepID=A0A6A2YBY9_HIBSY|nr:Protein translation factor SUI1-like protein [Hibiscus syriacus]
MSDLDAQIPTAFDPFADANADDSGAGAKEYVHIRIQQRNGRKSLTTVQGLKKEFSYNKILKRPEEGVLLQWLFNFKVTRARMYPPCSGYCYFASFEYVYAKEHPLQFGVRVPNLHHISFSIRLAS